MYVPAYSKVLGGPSCCVLCLHCESVDTQHNRKSHPAPLNTWACRWDYISNIITMKWKHSSFHQQFFKYLMMTNVGKTCSAMYRNSFNVLILNLSIWILCAVCLLTASLSLTFATTRYHNLLPWMIGHQVYLNAISYLTKYGQFGCESSHQEMST
jgi:hypothetical protein